MYSRIFLVGAVAGIVIVFSGCGKIVENFSYGQIVPSPIPLACTEDVDCMLTEQLYDPCGSVHSIHVDTPPSLIEAYNNEQMNLTQGVDYDCDVPPRTHEYLSMCKNNVCSAAKIQ